MGGSKTRRKKVPQKPIWAHHKRFGVRGLGGWWGSGAAPGGLPLARGLDYQLQLPTQEPKGGQEKRADESDVQLPQPQKKVVAHFFFIFLLLCRIFYRVLGRFVRRGVQKHEEKKCHKNPSGLITKNVGVFSSVFFPPLGCFARFFLSRFWAFRKKGS
jgi:hypothetical protein